MRVTALALSALIIALPSRARSQTVSGDALRAALQVMAHDSMAGRLTGSRGSASAAAFIVRSLQSIGIRGAGDAGKYTQDVPGSRVQIDSSLTSLGNAAYPYTYGVDFQPIHGIGGLTSAHSASGGDMLFAGRLGAPGAITDPRVDNKVVLLLPPLRANGQPDYQVWSRPDLLAKYGRSKALLIVSLELMPASVRRAMDRPMFELKGRERRKDTTPPLVAVSKATASTLLGTGADAASPNHPIIGTLHLAVETRAPDAPMQSVVAMIEGSDPVLKSEYVVLTARLDQAAVDAPVNDSRKAWPRDRDSIPNGANAASGATALLELASEFVRSGFAPRRSVIFLWTVGQQYDRLGSEWFVERMPSARDKIVANIDVDLIGHDSHGLDVAPRVFVGTAGSSSALQPIVQEASRSLNLALAEVPESTTTAGRSACAADQWSFAKLGIPGIRFTLQPTGDDDPMSDNIDQIDFDRFASVANLIGAVTRELATRSARPAERARPPAESVCGFPNSR